MSNFINLFDRVFTVVDSKKPITENQKPQLDQETLQFLELDDQFQDQFPETSSDVLFSKANIWIGKRTNETMQINKKSTYRMIHNDQEFIKQYFQLYTLSYDLLKRKQLNTSYSLFNQQLCYASGDQQSCIVIDTDVYIPDQPENNDQFLVEFLHLLQQMFKKYLRIYVEGQKFQFSQLTEENQNILLDFIIIARKQYDSDNNPNHPPKKDSSGVIYRRYGYHTYFYNLLLDGPSKKQLYQQIFKDQEFQQFVQEKLYPKYNNQTTLNEYFDQGPFNATSSLAFSCGNLQSLYTYILVVKKDSVKRISYESNPEEFKTEFMKLNPFRTYIPGLRHFGQNIEICLLNNTKNQNILDFMSDDRYKIKSYQESIRIVDQRIKTNYKSQDEIFWVYNNIVQNFNHPDWRFREQIVIHLYNILNKNILYTEFFYYIIMCENVYDILEDQEDDELQQISDYLTNNQRDRYPIKIHMFVMKVINQLVESPNGNPKGNPQEINPDGNHLTSSSNIVLDSNTSEHISSGSKKIFTKQESLQQLVKIFNNWVDYYEQQQGQILCQKIESNPFSLYGRFKEYLKGILNELFNDGNDAESKLSKQALDVYLRNFIFENILKDIKYIKNNSAKQSEMYVLYQFVDDQNQSTDYNHFQELDEQIFLSKLATIYNQYICEYSLIIKNLQYSSMKYLSEKEEVEKSISDNKELKLKYDILNYLIKQQAQLNAVVKTNFIITLLQSNKHYVEHDSKFNTIGVYNGVLEYVPAKKNFRMLNTQECIEVFQLQSTLFKIHDQFLDEDNYILSEEQFLSSSHPLLTEYQQAYRKIQDIFNGIFGEQINVLQWKIAMIIHQILLKNCANEFILIEYGTGGDGKSMNGEAIQLALGIASISNDQHVYTLPNKTTEVRKIQNYGYSASAKTSILATEDLQANAHDSGGIIQLKDAYYGNFAELSQQVSLGGATIKKLASGTSIQARAAYQRNPVTFINKAFLTLQTNNYPTLNQSIDAGIKRRLLFYSYPHKFVSQEEYDKYSPEQRKTLRIKNPDLQDLFQRDIFALDALGLYILYSFIKSQTNIIVPENDPEHIMQTSYEKIIRPQIPEIIIHQTQLFYNDLYEYYNRFLEQYIIYQDSSNNSSKDSSENSSEEFSKEGSQIVMPNESSDNGVFRQNEPKQKPKFKVLSYTTLRNMIEEFVQSYNPTKNVRERIIGNIEVSFNDKFRAEIQVYDSTKKEFIQYDPNKFITYSRNNRYQIYYYTICSKSPTSQDKDYKAYNICLSKSRKHKE